MMVQNTTKVLIKSGFGTQRKLIYRETPQLLYENS